MYIIQYGTNTNSSKSDNSKHKKSAKELSAIYATYKILGGKLKWNSFQKLYKNNEIDVNTLEYTNTATASSTTRGEGGFGSSGTT